MSTRSMEGVGELANATRTAGWLGILGNWLLNWILCRSVGRSPLFKCSDPLDKIKSPRLVYLSQFSNECDGIFVTGMSAEEELGTWERNQLVFTFYSLEIGFLCNLDSNLSYPADNFFLADCDLCARLTDTVHEGIEVGIRNKAVNKFVVWVVGISSTVEGNTQWNQLDDNIRRL